jgi:enamine deaminase RidA (YjgF/YER057c/UK114 family)
MAQGLEAQVRQAFLNLEAVLGEVGMGLSDLVQINYYLLDPAGMEILRHIRADYLPEPPPASTALIVKALARPEWLFELDAIAARSSGEAR